MSNDLIVEKIASIQALFQKGRELVQTNSSLKTLLLTIQKQPTNNQSIICEGVSMQVAINSIHASGNLSNWLTFYKEVGSNYSSQSHIGLGWALAELNEKPSDYLCLISPENRWRIIDGYGYYYTLFKRRFVIRQQEIPRTLLKEEHPYYMQGVGRCLWHLSKGDLDKLNMYIALLNSPYKKDVWRGVGIAVNYVGELNMSTVQALKNYAKESFSSFLCGLIISTSSKIKVDPKTKNAYSYGDLFLTSTKNLVEKFDQIESEKVSIDFSDFEKTIALSVE